MTDHIAWNVTQNVINAFNTILINLDDVFQSLQGSQLNAIKEEAFTSEALSSGSVPGITTAFMEMKEDKSGQRAIIQISDDIKGNIFAHVLEFLYTGIINRELFYVFSICEQTYIASSRPTGILANNKVMISLIIGQFTSISVS